MLFTVILVIGYGAWNFQLNKNVDHAKSMLDRRINRIEVRTTSTAEPIGNLGAMERSLKNLIVQVEKAEKNYSRLQKRFLPLNSSSLRQNLKTEIAEKAAQYGMRVKRFEDGARPENDDVVPSWELELQEVNNRYSRPLMLFETKTTFIRLIQFLDSLKSLSYQVSPVKILKLEAWTPKDQTANTALQQQQVIDVELLLTL